MSLPAEVVEHRLRIGAFPSDFGWRLTIQRAVNAMWVVIVGELRQVLLQLVGVLEEDVVDVFPAASADEPFHKRM